MINFIKYRLWFLGFSLSVILLGMYFVFTYGFVYSIDFIGGGLIEFGAPTVKTIRAERFVEKNYPKLNFQKTSTGFIVKSTELNKEQADKITKNLNQQLKVKKTRFELVGPSVSSANVYKIVVAVLLAIVGILVYVAFQFKEWRFGVAAISALIHDSLVLVGLWAILGHYWGVELDVLFVTALLTTMSFSVHDTIVIFDKIQEEEQQGTFGQFSQRINWALNLTMMRSLNNSLTVVIMLSSLIILGGESTRAFAVSLMIGTVAGTYSSPFVATPIYYSLAKKDQN